MYKKARAEFKYGISKNSRERRKNEIKELEELEEENIAAYEEEQNWIKII